MRDRLRAGVAIYNAGEYHAAHDAWEQRWLELEEGTDDERLLHGLIQYTAAVHHATERNWAGATGLTESAFEYLEDLPADYRGIGVDRAREYLRHLGRDPERIERAPPWPLLHDGTAIRPPVLEPDALVLAATTIAADYGYETTPIDRATAYLENGDDGDRRDSPRADHTDRRLSTLLSEFVTAGDGRGIVYDRLTAHVDRLTARERDVEGLFD